MCPARVVRMEFDAGRCRCCAGIYQSPYGATGGCIMAAVETREKVAALGEKYKYGFVTDIEMERAPKGLSEDTVRYISAKKDEPEWMLEWRLSAFRRWLEMREPTWARVHYPKIDYQNSYYYAAPKKAPLKQSLREVDPH